MAEHTERGRWRVKESGSTEKKGENRSWGGEVRGRRKTVGE